MDLRSRNSRIKTRNFGKKTPIKVEKSSSSSTFGKTGSINKLDQPVFCPFCNTFNTLYLFSLNRHVTTCKERKQDEELEEGEIMQIYDNNNSDNEELEPSLEQLSPVLEITCTGLTLVKCSPVQNEKNMLPESRKTIDKKSLQILITANCTKCPFCAFTTKYPFNIARHVYTVHKESYDLIVEGKKIVEGLTLKDTGKVIEQRREVSPASSSSDTSEQEEDPVQIEMKETEDNKSDEGSKKEDELEEESKGQNDDSSHIQHVLVQIEEKEIEKNKTDDDDKKEDESEEEPKEQNNSVQHTQQVSVQRNETEIGDKKNDDETKNDDDKEMMMKENEPEEEPKEQKNSPVQVSISPTCIDYTTPEFFSTPTYIDYTTSLTTVQQSKMGVQIKEEYDDDDFKPEVIYLE